MTFHSRKLMMTIALGLLTLQRMPGQTVEVFGGYSLTSMKPEENFNRTTMNGWNTSVTGYPTRRFGITADFAGFYNSVHPTAPTTDGSTASLPSVSLRQYSFMAGPQIRLIRTERFETSFRAVFGGARGYIADPTGVPSEFSTLSYNPLDQTTFAALFGSNFDLKLSKRVSLRFSPGLYLTQYGEHQTQKNFRFSVGPVFRFGGES